MLNQEQNVIEKLRKKSSDIQVPENLTPESVQHMLEKKGKKKRNVRVYRIGGVIAACLVLVCGVFIYKNGYLNQKTGSEVRKVGQIKTADDYEEVYECYRNWEKELEKVGAYGTATAEDAAMEKTETMADTGSARDVDGGMSYSRTNVRQEGVDEGDIVKTDGRYLYILKNGQTEISVVDTMGDQLESRQTINPEDASLIYEMYLDVEGKKLVAICERDNGRAAVEEMDMYNHNGTIEAVTYDISNPEKPEELGRVRQSGSYDSSRMADGYLYLFSNYDITDNGIAKDRPETYVPAVNGELIAEKDICLPTEQLACGYTVLTSVSMEAPDKVCESKAILSGSGQIYVSNSNIYYYETTWNYNENTMETTSLQRISYQNGVFQGGAQATINGYIHDSFCIDEYKDHLRVVVTQGDTNAVYVLDMEFEETGSITELAKDERIYSARLMGDTGYFVTFRETDPLFSVDLSDPENPEIIGELKIPGFSDYLHPYGEGKLLGIGMNVDEKGMMADGVKLTMFDISDPSDVKEEDTYILKNVFSTDASYDYKAVLADVGKNIIGFSGYTDGGQNYYIFEYQEGKGFVCKMEEEINGNTSLAARGVYIDQVLYVIQGNVIEAYSLEEYKKVRDLIL